jgi:hypothetical protein
MSTVLKEATSLCPATCHQDSMRAELTQSEQGTNHHCCEFCTRAACTRGGGSTLTGSLWPLHKGRSLVTRRLWEEMTGYGRRSLALESVSPATMSPCLACLHPWVMNTFLKCLESLPNAQQDLSKATCLNALGEGPLNHSQTPAGGST